MQISCNTIAAVISFYRKELFSIYTESELDNIIRWVLEKQLAISGTDIATHPNLRINESGLTPLEKMCMELKANKPIQYVLGEAEFYGMKIKVNENVLIPRPETEELVEMVLKDISALPSLISHASHLVPRTSFRILDIGTGSGCIPIAIKKNVPRDEVFALDISDAALEIARHNATVNNASVQFFHSDILAGDAADVILQASDGQAFDVIVSNPPYVLRNEKDSLHPRVAGFEPHTALFVDDTDPILFYRRIAELAQKILKKGGKLWFECHSAHARDVVQMLSEMSFSGVRMHCDMAGLPRFAEAKRA